MAFIHGRNNLEGVVVLHEIQHEIKNTREEVFILKIDFQKAYDRVRWEFLEEVLHKKGFDPLWTSWIMQVDRGNKRLLTLTARLGRISGTQGEYSRGTHSPLYYSKLTH